jgi:peptidoglycan/xylan/chitin deacetylase (PgdA/CDA1 family)
MRLVVIFSGRWASASAVEHVEALAQAFPDYHFVVFHECPPLRWRARLRQKLRHLRRQPVSGVLELLAGLGARCRPRRHGRVRGGCRLPASLAELARPNVEYRRCASLRAPQTLSHLLSLSPWLGVALSAPILRPETFRVPQLGTINLHKSQLPDYRGMPPGFWELHDGAAQTGVTVHWVDEGLDTGKLLAQRPLAIPPYSTPQGLAAQLDLLGTDVLVEAVKTLAGGGSPARPQPPSAAGANRMPSWLVARRVRRRAWARRRPPAAGPLALRMAKLCGLLLFLYAWVPVRNAVRAMRGQAHTAVLLYHRVSDWHLDNVTVGVEQFRQHLRFFRRRYEVIDLETFLSGRGRPRRRPRVVLTFDDGYEDNVLAALLLRREGLPCTFFVSTAVVGGGGAFPHDLRRLGRRVPAMTWQQVRRLAGWGFTVSNHTANHINLAEVPPEVALAEVAAGRDDLQKELGPRARIDCLAYPYGRPSDISEEVRQGLGAAGVAYCFSAYGGTNPPAFGPLDVLRQGVDCTLGRLRLRAAIEGLAV